MEMDSNIKSGPVGFPAGDRFVAELPVSERGRSLADAMRRRVVVLDGAMGTMIQRLGLDEGDFRGERFAGWDVPLKGCNDILCVTAPDAVKGIHAAYLEAGADIIETNSFNANAVSLADYGLADRVGEINAAAARVARSAADDVMSATPGRVCWVAGSVGPTGKSLSMSQGLDSDNSAAVGWDDLVLTYFDQMSALIAGGVDLLQIETVFDGLNAKAAVYAARRAMEAAGRRVPVIVSVTLTESGRTLSGQTLDAFLTSIAHADPLAIALNCGFGADGMIPYVEAMQGWPFPVAVYPNAGLPNQFGEYDETPETMVRKLGPLLREGMLNIVGGCCGTTPDHIKEIARAAAMASPRIVPPAEAVMRLAGLESAVVSADRNFVNIGERCNVAGSRKFLRLVKEKKIDEAVEIARAQVETGAQVVDINMDDAMLDAPVEIAGFISRLGVEPDVARVPLMIDSSSWTTVMAGLKHVQGKPIVNSISLKEGESVFLKRAMEAREMGAAVVVMAFDEKGQADTLGRKIEVCARAYELLTRAGFPAEDIIFDPNVLAVATGIEAHNRYAVDFIDAVKWIKENLPGAKVSGGLSNLSFSFRGNNYVREAMHSVFLYHAISRGMDMAIVNAAAIPPVEEIPADLRKAVEDVLFDTDSGATDRLIDLAERIKAEREGETREAHAAPVAAPASLSAPERLEAMVRRGATDGIEPLLAEVMAELGGAVKVIDGPLMNGMNKVGELFGQGKMFLPQVVKSAHAMKRAVAWLTPYIEEEKAAAGAATAGKMVIATVKGDVHDIGKNIVDVIMKCNGFEMVDLGVMVPGEEIVERAEREGADFIGLSGLITPSLEEMCRVARLMERRGMRIPLMIGGATTSALHTAVKIAPCYGGPVIYTRDAAMMPVVAQRIMNPSTRAAAIDEVRGEQQRLRRRHELQQSLYTLQQARAHAPRLTYNPSGLAPRCPGRHDIEISVAEARELINWRAFFAAWKLDASIAGVTEIEGCDHCRAQWLASRPADKRAAAAEGMQLWKEARRALDYLQRRGAAIKARVILCPAGSVGDDILYEWEGARHTLPTLRQQMIDSDKPRVALADFVAPAGADGTLKDHIGLFAVTTGAVVQEVVDRRKSIGDEYGALLYQSVADRLVEAATELMHKRVRCELWGYSDEEPDANPRNLLRQYYQGIRPAIGYPSLPDQSLIFEADQSLHYNELGVTLTENGAMSPASSTTGYIFAHPDSRYFTLGPVADDQRDDYASRRGVTRAAVDRFLPPQL